jgi:elongation factor 2
MGNLLLLPNKGNVAFGSGKEQWGFTLTRFAKMYADKFKTDEKKMMERLWGDNYFNAKKKVWTKDGFDDEGKPLKRAFCSFVMDPINKLARSCMEGNTEQMDKILVSIGLKLTNDDRQLQGKHLLKLVMSKWINAAETVLEMMVLHLPSPKVA